MSETNKVDKTDADLKKTTANFEDIVFEFKEIKKRILSIKGQSNLWRIR